MDKTLISTCLVTLRSQRGRSQASIAEAAGLSQSTLDRLENARSRPRKNTLLLVFEACAREHPLTSGEIQMAVEATGMPPRVFEQLNDKAAQRGEIGDEGVKGEVDALLKLMPTEQLVTLLRAVRASMQSAAYDTSRVAAGRVTSGPEGLGGPEIPEGPGGLGGLGGVGGGGGLSSIERLGRAMGPIGAEVGPNGGRMLRVLGPEKPGEGELSGMVVQDIMYYEDMTGVKPQQPPQHSEQSKQAGNR